MPPSVLARSHPATLKVISNTLATHSSTQATLQAIGRARATVKTLDLLRLYLESSSFPALVPSHMYTVTDMGSDFSSKRACTSYSRG